MFLTVPDTVVKGSDITVQISVPNLNNFHKIANDDYYSDRGNWQKITIEFGDENLNQKHFVLIDYTGQTGLINKTFQVTSDYKSDFLLFRRLVIYDKVNGYIDIKRSEVNTNDLDMEF